MSKVCRTCKQDKDESAFDRHHTARDGLRPVCKECRALYEATQYKKSGPAEIVEAPKARFQGKTQAEILAMAIELRMQYYRDGAIDAIFDLATMPISENAMVNQVKIMAARLLAGSLPGDATTRPGEPVQSYDALLQSLNDAYQKNAPRIKSVRNTTVTFEEQPKDVLPN